MDPWGPQGEAQAQRWLVPGEGQSKLFPGIYTHGHSTHTLTGLRNDRLLPSWIWAVTAVREWYTAQSGCLSQRPNPI